MEEVILSTKYALDSISIYRNLLEDEVLSKFRKLLDYISKTQVELDGAINLYNEFFFLFAKSTSISLEEYILEKIIYDDNPFSSLGTNEKAASNDLNSLQLVSKLSSEVIKSKLIQIFSNSEYKYLIEKLPTWVSKIEVEESLLYQDNLKRIKGIITSNICWSESTKDLFEFHKNNGCGVFAHFKAFVWERLMGKGQLKGIDAPDPTLLSDLIGYELERSTVIENTLQFLNGFSANNVLLYGDRGTGKSSTVKAILNEYYSQGLRMIEIPKAYLTDFPSIIRELKNRPQKFIIFIDDLVFGDEEESYTALKAILEGGLESKTSNIVIYATSNRRHLIKEYFSERKGLLSKEPNDEIRAHDSIEEKLSLSDRFGINVIFSSPDQNRYLSIVEGLAEKRNLNINKENLYKEALKWAIWYNGRSARTARQFIDWLEGDLATREVTEYE
ncbi:MAG: ATP-binding protein [Clostridiaceae bacterium]|nr:ATP-binding protein [Clostridiaceae bacterium]